MSDDKHCEIITESHNEYYKKHIVYIDKELDEIYKYRNLLETLRTASKHDLIELIINCDGGYLDTMFNIIQEIEKTECKTSCYVHVAKSAAVNLFLCCDNIDISDYAEIMIHNVGIEYIQGLVHPREIKSLNFDLKRLSILNSKYQNKLLTKKQIDDLSLGDVEVYLLGYEVKEIIKKNKENKDEKL